MNADPQSYALPATTSTLYQRKMLLDVPAGYLHVSLGASRESASWSLLPVIKLSSFMFKL